MYEIEVTPNLSTCGPQESGPVIQATVNQTGAGGPFTADAQLTSGNMVTVETFADGVRADEAFSLLITCQ